MTLQQQALHVIEGLPDDQSSQVIQFAEYLAAKSKTTAKSGAESENGYLRQPGILKGKIVMSEDFDETPECFKEYM